MDKCVDYSTTRGPMTSYEIIQCDACHEMYLSRSSAQASHA
ncbi:MAG: hypothetical protein U0990_04905 [Candidatus Nanopelagicales bacterium]|nr:hypothetical protein [Candidatus Nanopelagicales bacterium]MDZ4249412.1 hypothetical protein [Candidatus Nanopelagicales bacterium]MDZ7576748.1 hypothetical protein [Candidatus Nanopelagicales bacterium]